MYLQFFRTYYSSSSNSIIKACLSPIIFIFSPIRPWWRSVLFSSSQFYLIPMKCIIYIRYVCILNVFFIYVYGQLSAIKNLLLLLTTSITFKCDYNYKYHIQTRLTIQISHSNALTQKRQNSLCNFVTEFSVKF